MRAQVGWRYRNNADKSLTLKVLTAQNGGDWNVTFKRSDGITAKMNGAMLLHCWTRIA